MGFFRQYSTMQKIKFLVASPAIFVFGLVYVTGGLMMGVADFVGDKLAAWVKGR